MDDRTFDNAARTIGAEHETTRRRALGLLAGLGLLLGASPELAEARKKKKKKKDKFRCTPDGGVCLGNQFGCCGLQCCLAVGQPEGGLRFCTQFTNTCCNAIDGGGACPPEFPVCCPDGSCAVDALGCFFGFEKSNGERAARLGGKD